MILSVVIVNYNVKYFLEQCLLSVSKALQSLSQPGEIIVIDNNSTDDSIDFLKPLFPEVRFISNTENSGFATACNQGAALATGTYLLFLNPDTLVPEDCFSQCLDFMQTHPEIGGLGIRMIDGSGNYLPESKRSFPDPLTSFYKLSGLSTLFPHSRIFARYYLGHLSARENHEVDVLAGAFLLMPHSVFQKIGGFDEQFFMYGEDIDLSYRIQKAGYRNYYFADRTIIHFKGESTKKGSLNYVRLFYRAMRQFVQKHQTGVGNLFYLFMLQVAIQLKAVLSGITRFFQSLGWPAIDAVLILGSFGLVSRLWAKYGRPNVRYLPEKQWIIFGLFTIAYLIIGYYAGLYDRRYQRKRLLNAAALGALSLLAIYSLLPETIRFSRGIVLLGSLLSFSIISIMRFWFGKSRRLGVEDSDADKLLIVGSPSEYESLLKKFMRQSPDELPSRVSVDADATASVGHWKGLTEICSELGIRQLVYCQGSVSFSELIESCQQIPKPVLIQMHAAGSHSIISSYSKGTSGDALSLHEAYRLSDPYYLRIKRMIDLAASVLFLLGFPVFVLLVKRPAKFYIEVFRVLAAAKTWIGYHKPVKALPSLRPAVIRSHKEAGRSDSILTEEGIQKADEWYARDYEPFHDIALIAANYRNIGT